MSREHVCHSRTNVAKTSNTTRLVDKLLLKEFVTREVCPDNRRKIEVSITQKGLNVLTELDPKVIEHEKKFSQNLTPQELEQLNLFRKIQKLINKQNHYERIP
jgi:DNA-binding MarR family transcriptional regulator